MKYEKEVRAGIALLDYGQFYGEDWRDKINWNALSMHTFSSCILGQLEPSDLLMLFHGPERRFSRALIRLELRWEGARAHGFVVPQHTYGDLWSPVYWIRYGLLTRTWKKLGPTVRFDSLLKDDNERV